ncbi:MAG: peptide chain release factor 1 [Myxococcota bacterium]|jgi:peptide chain release factor 1|nr:peptide chain release factor 1 [Myxococcales bacterium]MEC7752201.1 peptide chain release factor 1 [Myxococcota bacterium]
MEARIAELVEQFHELTAQLGDPDLARDPKRLRELTTKRARLEQIVELDTEAKSVAAEIADYEAVLADGSDPELAELAEMELPELKSRAEALTEQLHLALLPRDPDDDRNCILEIRAGTGGDEASLFVGDLYRMYQRLCERQGWKLEPMESNPGTAGGFKEIIARVAGEAAYGHLKWEAGTHRVQRVPKTESQGRIHTSAVTVAILPEAEEVDVSIDPNEVRVDVFRASGPGGQSVNTTDSAVRLTHIPSGVVVICQDEKSQHKNKAKAMTVLRSRIYEARQAEAKASEAADRKAMVGSGDRSEKIRTYNFPQDRVTDHRINLSVHNLSGILDGEVGKMIESLIKEDQTLRLQAQSRI